MRPDIATSPVVLDIETAGHPDAKGWMEPCLPDGRLTDPVKIAADIAAKEKARDEKLALDPYAGRIAAVGWWTAEFGGAVQVCRNELEEVVAISNLWDVALHRTVVGFNLKAFDLPYLVTRSRLLNVPHPIFEFSPYSDRGITDLFLLLTFRQGTRDQGVMKRSLAMLCKRFGIPCDETIKGKDVPTLVAQGRWDEVAAHCASDVQATLLLAQRLGVVPVPQGELVEVH